MTNDEGASGLLRTDTNRKSNTSQTRHSAQVLGISLSPSGIFAPSILGHPHEFGATGGDAGPDANRKSKIKNKKSKIHPHLLGPRPGMIERVLSMIARPMSNLNFVSVPVTGTLSTSGSGRSRA
jgi:hypothetical protein